MSFLSRLLILLSLIVSLSSCDRVKQGLLTVVTSGVSKAAEVMAGGVSERPLGEDNYQHFIETTEHVAVVVYYSEDCDACSMLDPVLERVIADVNGPVKVGRVDVNLQQEFTKKSAVLGLPDVRMFINGAQVDRFVGAEKEEMIRQKLEEQVKLLKSGDLPSRPPKEKVEELDPTKPLTQPMSKDWMPPGMERP